MKSDRFNEEQRVNKVVLQCYGVVAVILFIAYIVELIKGSRTLSYTLIFSLILFIPYVMAVASYKKNKETVVIKHIVAYGYGFLYAFTLLTSVTKISYVYIFPIFILLPLFRDWKYLVRVGAALVIVNIIYMVYYLKSIGSGAADITEFEIMMASVVMVVSFTVATSRLLIEINDQTVSIIQEHEKKQRETFDRVIQTSAQIGRKIEKISGESKNVGERATSTQTSISEIVLGTTETAESIQKQMKMTGNIQSLINGVSVLSYNIHNECSNSSGNIDSGIESMNKLTDNSNELQSSSKDVVDSMRNLEDKAKAVDEIVSLISGITKQTNLLALNASIEAARAGTSGKGFSVVADEIRKLADETQSATNNIKTIISDLEKETYKTSESVNSMFSITDKQVKNISDVSEKFAVLKSSIETLSDSVDKQTKEMEGIQTATVEITNSIESISAFSEELMANTESTKTQSEENYNGTMKINSLLDKVLTDVDELNRLSNE